jgi:hypothetical protein
LKLPVIELPTELIEKVPANEVTLAEEIVIVPR